MNNEKHRKRRYLRVDIAPTRLFKIQLINKERRNKNSKIKKLMNQGDGSCDPKNNG